MTSQPFRIDQGLTLREQIQQRFTRQFPFHWYQFGVEVSDSTITITGTVRTWYEKQLVQESLSDLSEFHTLRNLVEVV